jgi:hypothetical protein
MSEIKKVLSLGAGVQSSTIFMMSCLEELPRVDCAVFADTGWEPQAVYEWLEYLKEQGDKYGIPLHIVSRGNIRDDFLGDGRYTKNKKRGHYSTIPFYTITPNGSKGMGKRQCTVDYKVTPINQFLRREILGLKPRQRAPKELKIQQWLGISADEMQRMRAPRDKWLSNYYPLCGLETFQDGRIIDTKKRIRRHQCIEWMEKKGLPKPPRSACIGCPFHSNEEWRHIRDGDPEAWADALDFDVKVRNLSGMRGRVYIHRDLVPLGEADIDSLEEKGQQSLFGNDCEGMCGV